MNNKNTNNENVPQHLKDVFFKTPPASSTDFTGIVPVHTENNEALENISKMMNVPTSKSKK
ncbi:MAG: hypothetical protein E7615_01980 [Ruminococcaceae bacterium]|nr:hypothetical protein [Oscillospiraceae bacterium]